MQLHLINYGSKIRVKDGLFVVRYFDDKEQLKKEAFSPAIVECIWLAAHTTLSVAVLALAMKHNIDIVFTDKYHFPIGRFVSHRPHSTSKIQKAQAIISVSPQAFYFIKK